MRARCDGRVNQLKKEAGLSRRGGVMKSEEFRSIRDQLGISQSELGRMMGLTAREISRIENVRKPTRVQAAFIKHIAAKRAPQAVADR